jgi:tetratricopeptide (TPR) repeat protein
MTLRLVLLLAISSPVFAQHDHHQMVGWVPQEVLERPVGLREGVGIIHDPVTTTSKEAQAFYDQGIAYLHSYVWIEAARSFNQALRLDPNLAMAYVGLSRTYLNFRDLDKARQAVNAAKERSEHASSRERVRIEIMEKHLDAVSDSDNTTKHSAYKAALDKALDSFPEDAEMWILRGNAEEASAWGRGQRGGSGSINFYNAALARVPGHWGANHYLIHSNEFIGNIDEALRHGKIYADAAPSIPHAQHMYGHDLRRAGRIDEAIERFRRADQLEKAYYKAENIARDYDWHHTHNLSLLATSYQYQGKAKLTESILLEAMSVPPVNEYQEFFHKDYAEFLLNRRRYDDALTAASKLASGKFALARAAGHTLAGNAVLSLDGPISARLKKAKRELSLAETEMKNSSDKSMVRPYIDALRAEILLRSGKKDEAREIFIDVQKRVRSIPGPDAWMQAIYRLELIARLARENDDWQLAENAANQMLDHDKYYGGSQLAMALVVSHKGQHAAAKEMLLKAKSAWSKADPDFRELVEIEKHINRIGNTSNADAASSPISLDGAHPVDASAARAMG